MKYIFALGFIILSTFVCGNKCEQKVGDSREGNELLEQLVTKISASDEGPKCELIKINTVNKVPGEKHPTYIYNANFKIKNGKEQTCRVLVKLDFMEKGSYLVRIKCNNIRIISRLVRASGYVAYLPLRHSVIDQVYKFNK